ncbi:MAG: nucleotidyltransferase domain-containing protein [Nanoarchaeota archaeon]
MARRTDEKTLKILKKHLAFLKRIFNPEKIILFGSRARGDNLEESDFDLIVVSEKFKNMNFRDRIIMAYGVWDKKQGLDIICYTHKEFEKKKKQEGIVKQASKEGIILN